jgi:hypothetical protein
MRFQTAMLRIVDVVAIPLREVVGREGAEYYDGKIDGRLHEMEGDRRKLRSRDWRAFE